MLNSAIHMFEDIGRLSMAAKYYKVLIFMFKAHNLINGTVSMSAMRNFLG